LAHSSAASRKVVGVAASDGKALLKDSAVKHQELK